VRVRCYGAEWLAIPALSGSRKLWAIDASGKPRLEDAKLIRWNAGSVSLVVSPALRGGALAVERLWDVEGESDLFACVDAGLAHVVTSMGGASSLVAHDRHGEWLRGLRPREVCVVRDLDDAGRDGAEKADAWWRSQGVSTRIVTLPADLGEHGDLRDYLNGRPAREGMLATEPLGDACDLDAIANCVELVDPGGRSANCAELINLATVRPRVVEWLWPGRIPRGKLSVLDGDPDVGKSTITLDLAARVSTGQAMPDGAPGTLGGVLLLSAEDDPEDTILPRLIAAGADASRVSALPGVRNEREELVPVSIPEHLDTIERAIEATGAVLVVVDPFMAYLSGTHSSHKDQDVRRALAPFAKLAERTRAAVLIVRHLNKSSGGHALYRGGGSIGIIGAARSGLLAARDPDDDSRRVLAVVKSNLAERAPSLAYRLLPADSSVRLEWLGESTHSAASLLASPIADEERSAVDDAVNFLREALARGGVAARDLSLSARSAGISEATIRRARKQLGVTRRKTGMRGGWVLELPKALKFTEGAHPQDLSAFAEDERRRESEIEEHLL